MRSLLTPSWVTRTGRSCTWATSSNRSGGNSPADAVLAIASMRIITPNPDRFIRSSFRSGGNTDPEKFARVGVNRKSRLGRSLALPVACGVHSDPYKAGGIIPSQWRNAPYRAALTPGRVARTLAKHATTNHVHRSGDRDVDAVLRFG